MVGFYVGLGVLLTLTITLAYTWEPVTAWYREWRLARRAFAWFDTLGYPSTAGRNYVRVATGRWIGREDGPKTNTFDHGWLVEVKGAEFTVLTDDLCLVTYKQSPSGTPEHSLVDYQVLDLKATVAEKLAAANHTDLVDIPFDLGKKLSGSASLFAFARGCAANGLDREAQRMCALAADAGTDEDRAEDFVQRMSEDIGYAEMWRAVLGFGNPDISRRQLLARFRAFLRRFPDHRHVPRARETVRILEQMVKEDDEHAQAVREPLDRMTTEEKAAELIFLLRDQNGAQYMQPGFCDIWVDPRGEKSAAEQLLRMGREAVPHLRGVVNDRRFTRSVGYHRNFRFSHHVLRIGDCAQQIIGMIETVEAGGPSLESHNVMRRVMGLPALPVKEKSDEPER